MSENKICPLCGSNNVTPSEYIEEICEPSGGCMEVTLQRDTCNRCGTEGDFFDINESLIQQASHDLKAKAVQDILSNFSRNNVNFAGMERALGLPQRTFTKWKGGQTPSAGSVALLKFLDIFPWLLIVAEEKYDYATAQRVHVQDAMHKVVSHMEFNEDVTIPNSLHIEFHLHQIGSKRTAIPIQDLENSNILNFQIS